MAESEEGTDAHDPDSDDSNSVPVGSKRLAISVRRWVSDHGSQILVTTLGGLLVVVIVGLSGLLSSDDTTEPPDIEDSIEAEGDLRIFELPFDDEQINAAIDRNAPWQVASELVEDGSALRCGGNWYFELDGQFDRLTSNVGLSGALDGPGKLNVVINGATVQLLELSTDDVRRIDLSLGSKAEKLRLNFNPETAPEGACDVDVVFFDDLLVAT